MPTINFLIQYPNILKLLLDDFKELESGLIFIYERYSSLKSRDRLNYKIFDKEIDLLGWTVLK